MLYTYKYVCSFTLNLQPYQGRSALSVNVSTLHPKPYTLHPTPYTLNLNPKPCTLNPKP